MSLGYGGKAVKRCESEDCVYFSYSVYNQNIKDCNSNVSDGLIQISKSHLVNAKRVVKSNKKKKQDNKLEELLASGDIQIVDNSQCFQKYNGYDYIALRLCRVILNKYQSSGIMPEQIGFDV